MSSESERFELLDEPGEDEVSASRALALPVEAPAVRATRALEALKAQAETTLLLLEHVRDDAQIGRSINAAIEQVNRASEACWHLAQLRSTKGQA